MITMYQSDRNYVTPANDASLYSALVSDHAGVLNRGSRFKITVSGLVATINTGQAVVDGRLVEILEPEKITLPSSASGHICLVVDLTRMNTTTGEAGSDTYAVKVNQVYVAAITTQLLQEDLHNGGLIYQFPIAEFTTTTNATTITNNQISLKRQPNVSDWQPNTKYYVGDLIYINSLNGNDHKKGTISLGILRCRVDHVSTNTFPASSEDKWRLVDNDAYWYEQNVRYPYAIYASTNRIGNTVNVSVWTSSHNNIANTNMAWIDLPDTYPEVFRPMTKQFLRISFGPVQSPVLGFELSGSGKFRYGTSGAIKDGQWLHGSTSWVTATKPYWEAAKPD
ncbi:MAG: hypothetical protein ABF709_04870 [Leuconostoc pseudomesenteroides]|uniref:hypothetical protein n=1 Tax=Leuconostoc pseudomesenteroides TaxID=33968 RepID=UPI0039E7A42C